ncbi:MAG: hypothetical protein QXK12_05650 [Candidatus Nezhaarchaeales archaeon]
MCRYWHSLSKASSRIKFKLVAIDETGFRFVDRRRFTWYVVYLNSKRIVEVYVSFDSRTSIDVLRIVGKLGFKVGCVHGGGPWYNSLEWVKVKYHHITFGIRNPVEQAFRSLKHRLKRFHNFKHGSTKRTILN